MQPSRALPPLLLDQPTHLFFSAIRVRCQYFLSLPRDASVVKKMVAPNVCAVSFWSSVAVALHPPSLLLPPSQVEASELDSHVGSVSSRFMYMYSNVLGPRHTGMQVTSPREMHFWLRIPCLRFVLCRIFRMTQSKTYVVFDYALTPPTSLGPGALAMIANCAHDDGI